MSLRRLLGPVVQGWLTRAHGRNVLKSLTEVFLMVTLELVVWMGHDFTGAGVLEKNWFIDTLVLILILRQQREEAGVWGSFKTSYWIFSEDSIAGFKWPSYPGFFSLLSEYQYQYQCVDESVFLQDKWLADYVLAPVYQVEMVTLWEALI